MLKFYVRRLETRAYLQVEVYVPTLGPRLISFLFHCSGEEHAGLLAACVEDTFERAVQRLREEEYNKGYRDGRAKRKKKSYFSRWF